MNVALPARRLTVEKAKLDGYFKVPSVRHYLIVDPDTRTITHHKRGRRAAVRTRVVRKGVLA